LKHRKWNYRTARYFTSREVALIRDVFPSAKVKKVRVPPVWLVYGEG